MHRTLALSVIALELSACASTTRLYSGPTREPEALVHIAVRPSVARGLTLNGTEVSGYGFELEPGRIAVKFEIRRMGYGSMRTVWGYGAECRATFEGRAGQRYRIDGGQFRGRDSAFIGTKETDGGKGEIANRHVYDSQMLLIGWVEHLESGTRVEATCDAF